MSYEARVWAKAQPIKMSDGKCVLIALADCLNSETGACFPSQKTLAFEIGTTERTISEHLSKLEKAGYIKRFQRHRPNGTRTSDSYRLMMHQVSEQENSFSIEEKEQPEDVSFSQSLPEDFSPSPPEDFAQLPEDFVRPPEDSAQPPEDFARLPEESSPLELEDLNYNYESKYEPEERIASLASLKNSVSKEKDALDAFIDIWQEHKLSRWASVQVLTKKRKAMFSKLISDAGSFDAALELFSFAIQEAASTQWFQDRDLSLENIMSNDKIIQLGERFKTRQSQPEPINPIDLNDPTDWTAKDYEKHLGFVPDDLQKWGRS